MSQSDPGRTDTTQSPPLEVGRGPSKRKRKKGRKRKASSPQHRYGGSPTAAEPEKPKLPNLDPNDATVWMETARLAQEGNTKLTRLLDSFRMTLETIAVAEYDHVQKREVVASDLRRLAIEELDHYSAQTGRSWRDPRNQVVATRAGQADFSFSKNNGNDGNDYD